MQTNQFCYLLDTTTGEQYVRYVGTSELFRGVWFHIPSEGVKILERALRRYKHRLYSRLIDIDKRQYVYIERVRGGQFEAIVPKNPAFLDNRVQEVRNHTLTEIEETLYRDIQFHYYFDPVTFKIQAYLMHINHTGEIDSVQLEVVDTNKIVGVDFRTSGHLFFTASKTQKESL